MRTSYVEGESQLSIATRYGCDRKLVYNIVHYIEYGDIPAPVENYFELVEQASTRLRKYK